MAMTFIQEPVPVDMDDDDGMPPLVDNPYPSMTFTFSAEMTPITYSTDPTSFEVVSEGQVDQLTAYSPPTSPSLGPTRVPHSKKRDASYIPRPPNAFILFRSSFIRAQHIPGKIEGNHSALSKIIGKYWKALPREDKEVWEAKALVAQAEHRQKYPDWRFRPGANALAKVKDGPRKRTNRKGRGEAEKEERSREKRCAKIADLLVAGKKGADLEVAIEQYDCENGQRASVKKEGCGVVLVQFRDRTKPSVEDIDTNQVSTASVSSELPCPVSIDDAPCKQSRSLSPDAAHDMRFKTPLTAMFKRSSSAPAPRTRSDYVHGELAVVTPAHEDIHTINVSLPADHSATAFFVDAHEGKPRVAGDITETSSHASMRLLDVRQHASRLSLPEFNSSVANFSPPGGNVSQSLWTQTYSVGYSDTDTYSPSVRSFDSDVEDVISPVESPLAYPFDLKVDGESVGSIEFGLNTSVAPSGFGNVHINHSNLQSTYSSLKGWADDTAVKRSAFIQGSFPTCFSASQAPMVFDPDRVMKDAFAAASIAPYEDWGVAYTASESYRMDSARDIQSLQLYAQGLQDIARRQDDGRQLF